MSRVAFHCVLVLASLPTLFGAGCAQRAAERRSVEELNQTLQTLRAQNAAYQRQVEELNNQVFILSDKVDSHRVNEERTAAPQLPTVTLRPSEPAEPAAGPVEAPNAGAPSLAASGSEIEMLGEAAKENQPGRPVLRLYGDETPVFQSQRSPQELASPKEEVRLIRIAGENAAREDHGPPARSAQTAVDMYRQAYEALKAGRHAEAAAGFREFVRQHPTNDLADNAQYWLGECHYDQKEFVPAVREFRRVVEKFPQGNKVPDALLKAGFSYLAVGSIEAGRQTLEQLVRSYPRHEAAALATAKLAEIASPPVTTRSVRPAQEVP